MMMSCAPAPIEADPAAALASLRQASERWVRRERARRRVPSGVSEVDALLGGGWPQGKVGELVGPVSSGRTAVAAATAASATARGEVVAWLDAADALDPAAMAAAGVCLNRVLWVRPDGIEETVRAAELVLGTGGFTVVAVDLGAEAGAAPRHLGGGRLCPRVRGRPALALRLARAVERAGAIALVLAERPWMGTLAGATVALGREQPRWGGDERVGRRWLAGIALRMRAERGAAADGGARRVASGGAAPR